jgi:hypothetical protein
MLVAGLKVLVPDLFSGTLHPAPYDLCLVPFTLHLFIDNPNLFISFNPLINDFFFTLHPVSDSLMN